MDRLCWDDVRIDLVIERLMKDGRAWIDEQATDTIYYYFPSLFLALYSAVSGNESASDSISSATQYFTVLIK
uniref:Uncharacterized protein n=1 Tax=Panagrolaimus sp. ES5 TaxID=591445 RepID=A0AC34G701_9BILA